ncbi:MAG TPA: alpha/beta hydrolase [Solirubrobacterales bacterium]|nr:alpha/beta hydrolase [Solirubrobacterales bacterium]
MPGTLRSPVSRRSPKRLAALLALLAGATVVIATALSWHFSSRVIVPDHSHWSSNVEIVALSPHSVTLGRTRVTSKPGVYDIAWEGGSAVLGGVTDAREETVTRRLSGVRGYLLPGMEVELGSEVHNGTPGEALGLPYRDVSIRGELGPLPAWLVPGRSKTWAIVIHGHNGDRQNGLKVVPALHRLGLPALLVSYRNDLGAPDSPDGHHHLGLTEWRDVDAAALYALRKGARRLVLFGFSMGGAVAGRFMADSPRADRVAALVLDAPVVDWTETLEFNASEMGLPELASLPLRWAIGARADIDWEALDYASHLEDFELPTLLFHGSDDGLVPKSSSEELARALPDRVTYVEAAEADHVQAWNVAPKVYEQRLRRFLEDALPAPAPQRTEGTETKKGRPDGRPK